MQNRCFDVCVCVPLSVEVIRTLWNKLQNNNPELLSGFEEFLGRVTTELKSSQSNCASLETVIRK